LTTVVALGGNALIRPGERGTAAEQLANLRQACAALEPVLSEERIVITHGNGPQVGNELLRQERAAAEAPPLPLWLAVAQTQAEIGALVAAELRPASRRQVDCLVTHVVVAAGDPAFDRPTKPVGPFYGEAQARELERERGWKVVHEEGRGWRRVVASPEPLEIVELGGIRALLAEGGIVVACGGGGIPVVRRGERLRAVDAVIDKDRTSAVLAGALEAERLLILTDVDAVYRGFGGQQQEELRELSADEAAELAAELAEGSMGPKVEAAARFVRGGGSEAVITSFGSLERALAGEAGTRLRA
jgi:carbamate kinase